MKETSLKKNFHQETIIQKAKAIVNLRTLHDRELWAMRLCAELTGEVAKPWWDWSEIGVNENK